MKKWLSLSLALCMLLSLFCSTAVFAADAEYETVQLNGFTQWTQAELDTSSGNNGYANGCITKLTVVTDSQYIVGSGKQAIMAVKGGSQSYNNCIVNWTFGTGGPCTAGNVWAAADGSTVDYAAYDGIRIAVLNAKGLPANFSKVTLRVTHGWNYSSNMRYWEGTPVVDEDGYFYFDFASFQSAGSPSGADIYDYMSGYAKGISMLCYGGTDEETCYYSAVELYRVKGAVQKNALKDAVRQLESYNVPAYADEIAAAKAVINNDNATQEEVDAQTAIIEACIEQYKTAMSTGYTYVAMDGIQNWTNEEAESMNGFGSNYSVSDQCLVGDAKQSIKLTANTSHTRFCFATQKKTGAFSTMNPFKITNEADGKLSDYDGMAIAFTDENGQPLEITKFIARLMRDSNDWGSYWNFEASYTDFSTCYVNGYYHLNFADYPALAGAIDDVSILSILFYKDIQTGDVAYLSDIKAFKYEEPEIIEYEYLQLDGIQKWTEEEAASMNGFSSSYSISDKALIGNATQSLKLTATSNHTRFCFATQKKDGSFSTLNPLKPTDSDEKLSDYDGIAIAFTDENGQPLEISKFTARLMRDKTDWGSYWLYEANYTNFEECYYDGYYHLNFADYPNLAGAIDDVSILSILFYKDIKTGDVAYLSDIKAFRVQPTVNTVELKEAIATLKKNDTENYYTGAIEAAEALAKDRNATQEAIDAKVDELNAIIRSILLKDVDFDEDNIVVSFGAISDIHIQGSTTDSATKKYETALSLLKKYAGGKLDAVTIAGDISNSSYSSSIGNAFKAVTDAQLGDNANVFFITGNHDAQDSQWSTLNQVYSDLSKYTANDLASSQLDRGNRHMVINGYHYIGVNMMDYWNSSEAMFADQDLKWLETELAAARAAAPGQPIFVYVHAGVYGTTYGSDLYTGTYWGSKKIYSYLENYPEVVTFSGHVHFPLMDERTIYQDDFTSLNCGSVQYMAIENGYLQSGSKTTVDESHQVSGGLLVQVDKNNNLKITRINFTKDEIIKEPFYISAPDLENKSNLLHYNDDYFNMNNTAPVFDKNAAISGKIIGNYMQVTFNAATDNDMVHNYVIEIKDLPGGAVKTTRAFSNFYLYSDTDQFPSEYKYNIPYTTGTSTTGYEITVYAVDSMGMKSEPIVYKSAGGETPDPDQPTVDNLFENGDFEIGSADGWATYQGSGVAAEAAYNGSYGFKAIGNGGWGSMFSQTLTVEPNKQYKLSFWVKAVNNGVNIQVREDNWQGTPVAGTGGWYSTVGYDTWTYVEYDVISSSDTIFFNVNGAGNGINECAYFDDIMLVDVSAPTPPAGDDDVDTGAVENGTFETGDLLGWHNMWGSCTVDFVEGYNSTSALHLQCNQWNHVRQDGVPVKKNTDYVLTAWVKNASHFTLLAKKGDDSGNIAETALDTNSDEWTLMTVRFNSGDESTVCILLMGNEDGASAIIDNVSLFEDETIVIYGDANADGKVNNKDLGAIQQFLNDWDIEIDQKAADANADGKVNNKDLGLLQQYLNDWDVTLGPVTPDQPDDPIIPDPIDPDARPQIKILSIGHSFSKDAMVTYMWDLFDAAGYDVTIGYLYIGGCALERHYHNILNDSKAYEEYAKNSNGTWKTYYSVKPTTALYDEDWDIITFQPSPDYGQGKSYQCKWGCNKTISNDYVHFGEMVDLVKGYLASDDNPNGPNTDVQFYYHLTWAFANDCRLWSFAYSNNDQMTMYNDFIKATKNYVVPNSNIKGVIPCITSIQNARSSFMGDTFNMPGNYDSNADGYHLNDKGDLVAAMTWVAYFTGKDAMSFKISTQYSDEEYAAMAEAVDNAIKTPWAVTESSYK